MTLSGEAAAIVGKETDLLDEQGLRAAHRAYAGELYRFALRQLGDRGAAENVVHEGERLSRS